MAGCRRQECLMNTEKDKKNMTIDEEKIREAAEGEADDKLKEECVRAYCEVLDMISLVEADPYRVGLASAYLRGNSYSWMA